MKIQLISQNNQLKTSHTLQQYPLESPKSFDEFDLNIVDLQDHNLWVNAENDTTSIDKSNDLRSIQTIMSNSKTTTIIALPQNYTMKWYAPTAKGYRYSFVLKDALEKLQTILSDILPDQFHSPNGYPYKLVFENCTTTLNGEPYQSAFWISPKFRCETITTTDAGNHISTLKVANNCYVTTIDMCSNGFSLDSFLIGLGLCGTKLDIPQWLTDYNCFDDQEQKETIAQKEAMIKELSSEIAAAQKKLDNNQRLKSILISNGDQLISVVFEILQNLFDYDLSSFVDERREDFVIDNGTVVFVGEVKGINTNVKYDNISQAERHGSRYRDDAAERGENPNVKVLLIINTLRKKALDERDKINDEQIEFARKRDVLIITTEVLLRLYEKFCSGLITKARISELFAMNSGAFELEDF